MKKNIAVALFVLLMIQFSIVKAQKFSVGFMCDATFPAPFNNVAEQHTSSTYSSDSSKVKGTFAGGKTFYLCLEYATKSPISFNVNIGYFKGFDFSYENKDADNQSHYTYEHNSTTTETHNFKNISQYQINPTIKFTKGIKVKYYLKAGLSFGIKNKLTEEINTANYDFIRQTNPPRPDTSYSSSTDMTKQYSKGISIGFIAGTGIEYTFWKKYVLFSDISFIQMSWLQSRVK